MPYKQNPFYQYRNQSIGQMFGGLAAAGFVGGGADPRIQSGADENIAQARQAQSMANYNAERTRGERYANDIRQTSPTSIAELLIGGGVMQDDPLQVNSGYQPRQATDFADILTKPMGAEQEAASVFMPNRSAKEKLAEAIVWAANNKMNLDDVLKAAGISGYQQRINSANPDSALGYAPFVGVNPNTQTALTTTRQDSISARDSAEDIAKQTTVNDTNLARERLDQEGRDRRNRDDNQTNIAREKLQQGGANWRTQYSKDNAPVTASNNSDVFITKAQADKLGVKPNANGQYIIRGRATVGTGQDQLPGSAGGSRVQGRERVTSAGGAKALPSVPAAASKRIQSKIESGLQAAGVKVDNESMIGLLSAAGSEWQSSKNPDSAADSIMQQLLNGETVNGVTLKKGNRTIAGIPIPGTERKSTSRSTAPAPAPATVNQPPQAAIDFLRANPNLKADFEAKYGAGSAAKYIKNK